MKKLHLTNTGSDFTRIRKIGTLANTPISKLSTADPEEALICEVMGECYLCDDPATLQEMKLEHDPSRVTLYLGVLAK